MTVKDLIEYLQELPQEAVIGVVYQICSNLEVLHKEDICLVSKDHKPKSSTLYRGGRFVLRNGQIMEYNAATWDPAETPHFVDVLIFPGN